MNLLAAVSAESPNVWAASHKIFVEPVLSANRDTDPIEGYKSALEELFALIETTFNIEEVIAYLAFNNVELEYMVENNIGRGGGQLTEPFKSLLIRKIQQNSKGLERLTEKI